MIRQSTGGTDFDFLADKRILLRLLREDSRDYLINWVSYFLTCVKRSLLQRYCHLCCLLITAFRELEMILPGNQ